MIGIVESNPKAVIFHGLFYADQGSIIRMQERIKHAHAAPGRINTVLIQYLPATMPL